jgi:putative transposase
MIRFAFRKGLAFFEGTQCWTLQRRTPLGKLQFENELGELRNVEQKELNRLWGHREWIVDEKTLGVSSNAIYSATPRDLASFSQADQKGCVRKQKYVVAASQHVNLNQAGFFSGHLAVDAIKQVALATKDPKPPTLCTVYLWWRRYMSTKCVTKLVDGRARSGRTKQPTQIAIFEEAVSEVYLTSQKESGKRVYEEMVRKISRTNTGLLDSEQKVRMPSKATIYRWLEQLHHVLVLKNREGSKVAALALKAALSSIKITGVLQRVEIDHTPIDCLVIDATTKLVLGRPWLTLAIDRYSRAIVGFYLTFNAPSAYSVMYCLKMATLPKTALLSKFGDIKFDWSCFGICDQVVTDNGMDLHSKDVEILCADLGIEILYCPTAEPQMKGAVERFFRTISHDLFHALPGTTFSNPDQRGDYPAEKLAAIDMETLTHLIVKWIVDDYHQTPHRGLAGRKPHDVWEEGAKQRVIELPAYPEQFNNIIGQSATPTLFHYGLEVDNLRYNSPQLQEIRARKEARQRVAVKYFDDTVDYINVLDPDTHEYITVPAVNMEYAADVSRHAHRLICAEMRKRFAGDWHQAQLLETKAETQAIVAAAIKGKKMAVRKRAAVAVGIDSRDDGKRKVGRIPIETKPLVLAELEAGLPDDLPMFHAQRFTEIRP